MFDFIPDKIPVSAWPEDMVAVLGSALDSSCTTGLSAGTVVLSTAYKGNSAEYTSSITGSADSVQLKFCTKGQPSASSGQAVWEAGKYCIFRVGISCPDGMF